MDREIEALIHNKKSPTNVRLYFFEAEREGFEPELAIS